MQAVTTLAFVAPVEVIPIFLNKINSLLAPGPLQKLGTYEYGVWTTPQGTPFVDGVQNCLNIFELC